MREWLKRNKIYFELISMFLSILAILLSIFSYSISKHELRTAEISIEPYFYVENRLYKNLKTGFYEDVELLVHNTGNPAYNLSVSVLTFIQIQRAGIKPEKIYVPINGYYVVSYHHANPQGPIATFEAPKSNKIFADLYFATLKEDVQKKYGTFFITFVPIIKIKYEDRLGRVNEVFFWEREKVDKKYVEPLLQISKDIFSVEFRDLNISELIKRESEIIEYMKRHTL